MMRLFLTQLYLYTQKQQEPNQQSEIMMNQKSNKLDAMFSELMRNVDFIRSVAETERNMDAGTQPYIVNNGSKLPVIQECMDVFGLVSGQSAGDILVEAVMDWMIRYRIAQVQQRVDEQMMQKADEHADSDSKSKQTAEGIIQSIIDSSRK